MKKEILLIGITAIVLTVGFSGCLENEKNAEATQISVVKYMPIPALGEEIGSNESCGTLYCIGEIIQGSEGVEAISFTWKANVTFPGDTCMGDIYVPLFNVGSWHGYFPIINPYNVGTAAWTHAKGEHHVWEYKITLYYNDTYIEVFDNGTKTYETWLNDIAPEDYQGVGLNNITDGKMEVYGAFRSMLDGDSEFSIDISTDPFTLVREGNNFYLIE